jgi:hypothetical protein
MTRIPDGPESRITRDVVAPAIRSWFSLQFRPAAKAGDTPEAIARTVLVDSADLFNWAPDLPDIPERGIVAGLGSNSVRFSQSFKNLPVDSSDIVVNFDAAGHLTSIYNDYHYDIPAALDPKDAKVTEAEARRLAESFLAGHEGTEFRHVMLIVYQYRAVTNHTGKPGPGAPPRARVLALLTS